MDVTEAQAEVRRFEALAGIADYDALGGVVPNEFWHDPGVGNALSALGFAQWDAEDHAGGVASMRDRVKVYQRLVEVDPGTYRPVLAQAILDLRAFAPDAEPAGPDPARAAAARLAVGAARRGREIALRSMHDAEAHANFWREPDGSFPVIDPNVPGNRAAFDEVQGLQPALDEAGAALAAAEQAHAEASAQYEGLAAAHPLFGADNVDPILLLPVRIEAIYTDPGAGPELWIRVYPDDVHVDNHEPALTAGERDAGVAYWRELFTAADDEPRRDLAWQTLVGAAGGYRATWVRDALTPTNQPPGEPAFPAVELQDQAWMRAAHTRLLPDRLEFSAYRDGGLVWRRTGADIPDTLPVGLAPPAGQPDDDPDALPWDEHSRWLVDFPDAVAKGMGLVVTLAEADERFDLLTVVGLGAQDPAVGGQRVQAMLSAHAVSSGLSPLQVGTPTNNTPGSRSGWRSRPVPPHPDLVAVRRAAYDPASDQEAARLARALGVPGPPVLSAVCDPIGVDEPLLHRLHRLQVDFMAWSRALQPPVEPLADPDPCIEPWYLQLGEHYARHVRARGPLPPLRIGRQPYGVLPVSALELWRGDDADSHLSEYVASFHAAVAGHVDRARRVGEEADQDAVLLDLLSQQASPVGVAVLYSADGGYHEHSPLPAAVGSIPPTALLALVDASPAATPYSPWPEELPEEILPVLSSRPVTALLTVFDGVLPQVQANPAAVDSDDLFGRWSPLRDSLWPLTNPPTASHYYRQADWVQNFLFNVVSACAALARGEQQPAAPDQLARSQRRAGQVRDLLAGYAALEADAVADLARFEARLRETFEPLSHRIDAWVTSLATARLDRLREAQPDGVRTGAYGWLTEIERADPNPSREGFVVTPSMHHATTAAVLRSGYQAHTDKRAFAVDIQSTRVRRAQAVVEGLRAGQTLDALLGYQFERAAHDGHLDQVIAGFRAAYPLAPLLEPEGGAEARIAIGARNVVDGQALRRDRARLDDDAVLQAVAGAALAGSGPALRRIIAELDETFDAVGDLLLAESVHHLVGGSAIRAGLAADGMGRGQDLPSEYDVVRTPRSGVAVTHHVGVLLPGGPPAGWSDDRPLTRLEPGVEGWLRRRLGPAPAALASWCALDLLVAPADTVRALGDFEDLLAVAEQLRGALSSAVPLGPPQLPGVGWDVADLQGRVGGWLAEVRSAGDDAVRLGELGLPVGAGDPEADRARLRALLDAVDLTGPPAPPAEPSQQADWVARVLDVTAALLHPAVKVAPILIGELPGAPSAGAEAESVRGWLRDMALVRTKVDALDSALVAAEVIQGTPEPAFVVAQPPDPAGGAAVPWLATSSPAEGARPRASLVLQQDGPGPVRGLVVDSWSEVVPARPGEHGPEEVIGVAFDFDRPGARAPQSLLLAVPPDRTRGWCLEDVHGCVEETLLLSRIRTLDLTDVPELRTVLPVPNGMG